MAYATPRKLKRGMIEGIKEEIAIHREACLTRIEAGASESAKEQAILCVKAVNRYKRMRGLEKCKM